MTYFFCFDNIITVEKISTNERRKFRWKKR
nr:MAG TPA: hypothetical protein [Caudoviricetes sp.]